MTASPPGLLRTPTRTVALPEVPDALRKLWRACVPEGEGGEVARSLTANFVGVAFAADGDHLQAAVERLQRRTPCRAFLLRIDEQAGELRAAITATMRCQGKIRDIMLEEIVIRLPEADFAMVPGFVRPLLVNDLPTHLYWAAPWSRATGAFDEMTRLCDHVVVDSRRCIDAPHELAALAARRAAGERVTDLGWLRLRPWRRALADAFERVPWHAGATASVVIHHGRRAAAAAQLLGEWLDARLGSRTQRDPSGAPAGSPESAEPHRVVVKTVGHEIELAADAQQITVHVTTPEHCLVPFRVPTSRSADGDLLAAAIDIA